MLRVVKALTRSYAMIIMVVMKEIIQRTLDRISDPQRWCQNAMGRDKGGQGCQANDPRAVAWCAAGALLLEAGSNQAYADVVYAVVDHPLNTGSLGITGTNDSYGHERVLQMLRNALTDVTP